MGRMNIYLSEEEDSKLKALKISLDLKSKEDVLKKLIELFEDDSGGAL